MSAAACQSVSVEKQVIKAWVFCFLAPVQGYKLVQTTFSQIVDLGVLLTVRPTEKVSIQ